MDERGLGVIMIGIDGRGGGKSRHVSDRHG